MQPALRCVMTTHRQSELLRDPRMLRAAAQHHQARLGIFAAIGAQAASGSAIRCGSKFSRTPPSLSFHSRRLVDGGRITACAGPRAHRTITVGELALSAREIVVSSRSISRLAAARAWLDHIALGTEALIVAPSQEAGDDLGRALALEHGASFGLHRLTLNRLSGLLASEHAAAHGLAYVSGLGAQAIAARALFALKGDPCLAPLGALVHLPGLPKAIAATYAELSHALIEPSMVAKLGETESALAAIFVQFERQLGAGHLIHRAGILKAEIAALAAESLPRFAGLPTLLLDLPIESLLERDFVAALAARAPSLFATAPVGAGRSLDSLAEALGVTPRPCVEADRDTTSLSRVQEFLFAGGTPAPAMLDETVTLCSAAGEMQECVEIARRIQAEARRGVPFDRIAVLLHAPTRYAPYLEEALARAGIPAWFSRGAKRAEPGGRALLALLNCAAERLSARRFAEYLALAQVPEAAAGANASAALFAPADPEFLQAPDRRGANPDGGRGAARSESASDWRATRALALGAYPGGSLRHRRTRPLGFPLARPRSRMAAAPQRAQ